jgi:hypothetical protein
MDTIQFSLAVPLYSNSASPGVAEFSTHGFTNNPHSFFFKKTSNESLYPLLIAYLAYLRKINGTLNSADVSEQNAQQKKMLAFLCEHNLLYFLLISGQFILIEKLFGTHLYYSNGYTFFSCAQQDKTSYKIINFSQNNHSLH